MAQETKTKYPGVFYKEKKIRVTGKIERVYYIYFRTADGAQHHEKVGSTSSGMTEARANAIRVAKLNGKEPTNKQRRQEREARKKAEAAKYTLDRLWVEYKAVKNIKSIQRDDNRYKADIAPSFGKKAPEEITHLEIDRFKTKLLKTKKPATVKNILELLLRICNFGFKRKLCKPLDFVLEMPSANNQKTEDVTPDQLKRLLQVLDEEPDIQIVNIMKMALFTGMRRGELLKLKWEDIDFDKEFIFIRDPKGGQDQMIPLNDASRKILESHPRINEWVFASAFSTDGQRHSTKYSKKIAEKAGLPADFRPLHGLRHVYASMLASSGKVDMYTLQKLLTHKSPQMTQRYAHLRDEALKNASQVAVNIVEDAIAPKETK